MHRVIQENSLTDQLANMFFQDKITAASAPTLRDGEDWSFLTTARALLFPKMGTEDYLDIAYCEGRFSRVDERSAKNIIDRTLNRKAMLENRLPEKKVSVLEIVGTQDYEELIKGFSNYKEIDKVRLFFARNFACSAYYDEENRATYLLINTHDMSDSSFMKAYHSTQCSMLNLFPQYFDAGKGAGSVDDRDMELIKAIATSDLGKYLTLIDEYCEEFDFRQKAIYTFLDEFEIELDKNRFNEYERQIRDMDMRIDDLLNEIARYSRNRREAVQTLEGIKRGIDSKKDHILRDMFIEYPSLRFITNTGNGILFAVDKYCDDWSQAAFEDAFLCNSSSLYRGISARNISFMKKLCQKIFAEREIKIKMTGVYQLHSNGMLQAISGRGQNIPQNYMPNPHIYNYACIEGFAGDIAEATRNQDFALAVEIAMQTAGNINFDDSTVMERMGRYIVEQKCEGRNCFELPDGSMVGVDGVYEYMRKQEEEMEVNNEQDN